MSSCSCCRLKDGWSGPAGFADDDPAALAGDQVDLVREVAQRRLLDRAPGEDEAEPDRERDADEDDDPDRPEQPRTKAAAAHLYAGTSL